VRIREPVYLYGREERPDTIVGGRTPEQCRYVAPLDGIVKASFDLVGVHEGDGVQIGNCAAILWPDHP
jgi:RNA-splicing ligase RtcB